MPSLKEIKGRIASVNSTRKITSAMKMVASSKLHHAQVAIQNMLPYETLLEHILKSFLAAEADSQTPFDQVRPVQRVALVVFSSNSSLCGGFNANTIKMMTQAVDEYAQQIGRENIEIYPIGRKVYEKANKMGLKTMGEYSSLADKPNAHDCIEIAREIPICISAVFQLVACIAYAMVWKWVSSKSPASLPTLYLSASACRMFAAIVVVIIYCLVANNRDSILFFVVTFLIYYFVILIYDTWYFVKIEKKIKNNV